MARTEGALRLRIAQLKKLIAMLRLGGAATRAEVEKSQKELKDCEAELLGLQKAK